MPRKVTVCAAHAAPVFMNAAATAKKACRLIHEAAARGADIVAFPESFVPGFPLWAALAAPIHNHEFFVEFASQSVRVPGPEVGAICAAAREANIIVSIGVSESTEASVGCLWNTNLLIDENGAIINHHRKLVPTFYEKLIWANGDAAGLNVCKTRAGRIGMLICGENTNPLARFSLMAQGEEIHVSSYPPAWPTHVPESNQRYDLASAIAIRAGAHSFEGKVFNVVASAYVDESAENALRQRIGDAADILLRSPSGVSMIVNPHGMPIAEVSSKEDTLLTEEVNLEECVVPKQFHDVVGYYNRFDIFKLSVSRGRQRPVTFFEEQGSERAHDRQSLGGNGTDGVRRGEAQEGLEL
jgi:nitrilase